VWLLTPATARPFAWSVPESGKQRFRGVKPTLRMVFYFSGGNVEIQAIPTEYRGYKFRSRLEARWAVFFDSIGVEWAYEHEGYDIDGEWYLPDFWIRTWNCFVEIKPEKPKLWGRGFTTVDARPYRLCKKLAEKSGHAVLLIGGTPISIFDFETGEDFRDYYVAVFCPDVVEKIDLKLEIYDDAFATRVNEGFYTLDSNLYGMLASRMPHPIPNRGDWRGLIELDKKYQTQKNGRYDGRWDYGLCETGLTFLEVNGDVVLGKTYGHGGEPMARMLRHYKKALQFNPQ
jgi:hypothetical protein